MVLTPTAQTDEGALQYVERFWQALGAETLRMTPDAHDQALAATSHLPHWVAAALAARRRRSISRLWRAAGRIQHE